MSNSHGINEDTPYISFKFIRIRNFSNIRNYSIYLYKAVSKTVVKIKNKTCAQLGCSFLFPMTALKIQNKCRVGLFSVFFVFLSSLWLCPLLPFSRRKPVPCRPYSSSILAQIWVFYPRHFSRHLKDNRSFCQTSSVSFPKFSPCTLPARH